MKFKIAVVIAISALGLGLSSAALAGRVDVCGDLPGNTTWTAGNVYVINCDSARVPPGVTLTVQAGAIVKFRAGYLTVDGAMNVAGGAGAPAYFTSYYDDSVGGDTDGDGGARAPLPADWNAVTFNAGSTGNISGAVFSYGGGNYWYYETKAEVRCYSGGVRLTSCTFRKSGFSGVYADRVGISVDGCTFGPDNAYTGIYLVGGSDSIATSISNSTFISPSGSGGIYHGEGKPTKELSLSGNRGQGACAFTIDGSSGGNITVNNGSLLPTLANLTVSAGHTLSFSPGSIVKSNGNMLDVNGTLIAQGTPAEPIIFTSWWDDTAGGNSDGDTGDRPPGRGDWQAITFGAGSTGRIANAKITYGGSNYWLYDSKANVRCYSDDVSLEGVTFDKSGFSGLYVERSGIRVSNCTFGPDNAVHSLKVVGGSPASALQVTGNLFKGTFGSQGRISGEERASLGWIFRGNRANCPCGLSLDGTAGGDITWENGGDLQIINGLTVGAGSTFNMGPGTIVKSEGTDLSVRGTLLAPGTPDRPVAFTSLRDDSIGGDTNGDGGATQPAPANWNGITFGGGSHGQITWATISYGGGNYWYYGSQAGVRCYSNDVELDGVKLKNNNNKGMYAEAGPRIRKSSITGNNYGIQNGSTRYWVDARGNWWGDPTGPYHPVKNPSGKGQPASDFVLFFPWAEDESGTILTQAHVYVEGPSRASAGQTVEYLINYETGADQLNDVVLAVGIPLTGNPLDCDEGTFLQETGEVFWEIGTLPPYSTGSRKLRVEYMWGVPEGFEDGLTGLLLARNLNLGSYTFDIDRYLDYTPLSAGPASPLSQAEIQAELNANPGMKTLYDRAVSRGFILLGGKLQSFDGAPTTVLTMASYSLRSVAEITRDRSGGSSIMRSFGGVTYTVEDPSGALALELEVGSGVPSGGWSSAQERDAELAKLSKGLALRNCLIEEIGCYALTKMGKTLAAAVNGVKCTKGLLTGDPDNIGDCLSLIEQTEKLVPLYGEMKSIHKCYQDVIVGGQVDKYACSGALLRVEPPGISWNPVSWTEDGRRRMYVKYNCNDTTQTWGLPETLYCPPGFIAQEGVVDDDGRPCVPANETVAFAYGIDARRVPCQTRSTAVRRAKDPNAKRGPAGDMLAGDTFDYTVEYENVGEGIAYGVFITDTLSDLFDDSTLSLGGNGSYSPGSRMIFWEVGDLPPKGEPGSKGEVNFSVKLKAGTPDGATVSNQAVVFFPSVPEETPTNSVLNTVATVISTPRSFEMITGGSLAVTLSGRSSSGMPMSFALSQPPLYGELSGSAPNLTYRPKLRFTGSDRFLFTASDGTSTSSPAEIAIVVNPDPDDRTPPIVSWTSPSQGHVTAASTAPALSDATGPVYPPTVEFGFSEVVDTTTVNASTVQLKDASGAEVESSVAYDAQSGTGRITVRQPWRFETYTCTLTTGIKDLNGNALASPFTWSFGTVNGSGVQIPGDCDGSGIVTIGEVQKAINMFLGTQAPGCGVDCNGDGKISIGEVQKVINAFLGFASSC